VSRQRVRSLDNARDRSRRQALGTRPREAWEPGWFVGSADLAKAIVQHKTRVIDIDLVDAHPRHDWLMTAVEKRLREELAALQVEVNE
jgi:hypothetical protein